MDTGLHCAACKEPTVFCWALTFPRWDINTRSCPVWTLDGRDRTITVLQHAHRCLTMQTSSISYSLLSLTHKCLQTQTTTGRTGRRLWNPRGLSGWWDTFSISGLASIQTNPPLQKDKREAMRESRERERRRGNESAGKGEQREPGVCECQEGVQA